MFVWPLVNFLLVFPTCLLTFVIVTLAYHLSIHNTRYLGSFFLVSPFYFSTPSRVTPDNLSCTLFPRYAYYKLLHGIWEMDGLSRCACRLVVNTLLFRVGCLFQRLIESGGRGGCAAEGCTLTTSSVTRFGLENSNGKRERVGG